MPINTGVEMWDQHWQMSGDVGINAKESFKEEFKGEEEGSFGCIYRHPKLALLCWMKIRIGLPRLRETR